MHFAVAQENTRITNVLLDSEISGVNGLTCTGFQLTIHYHSGLAKTLLPRHNKSSCFLHQSSFICLPLDRERARLKPNSLNLVLNFASLSKPTVSLAGASSETCATHQPVSGRKLLGTHARVNPSEADNPSPTA